MDIPDDWNKQYNLELYKETFDQAIFFQNEYPDTLWCWGNHDLSYVWNLSESGYSKLAENIVSRQIDKLIEALPNDSQIAYIHRIDNVLFLHGGLSEGFVKKHLNANLETYNDVDKVVNWVNGLGPSYIWSEGSPLWLRPQYNTLPMYKSDQILQVVGHTPVKDIIKDEKRNFISCDVFSTYRDGSQYGTNKFLFLDTEDWSFQGVS